MTEKHYTYWRSRHDTYWRQTEDNKWDIWLHGAGWCMAFEPKQKLIPFKQITKEEMFIEIL